MQTLKSDKIIIDQAYYFARAAHGAIDQRRKYTNEPYINHPVAVKCLISEQGGTPEMQCAALLHDVVEDTEVELDEIEILFGRKIAEYVFWLTEVGEKSPFTNRAYRKAMDRAHLSMAPPEAKSIKLADLIDNTRTIAELDPKFAKTYMEEKRLLLEVLKDASIIPLWLKAKSMIDRYFEDQEAA